MIGYRAFGKNEGSLGHAGDFQVLFRPLIERLAGMAVYGLEPSDGLTFPFFYQCKEINEANAETEALLAALNGLDICPHPKAPGDGIQWPRYYRAGFFPTFAPFIQDDWNDLVCFSTPFPDYGLLSQAHYGEDPLDYCKLQMRTPDVQRQAWLDTDFSFYFRNIDACWWEVFSPDENAMRQLHDHFRRKGIDHQELRFDRDFPVSSTGVDREFRDVHVIWPPKDGQQVCGEERS